MHPVLIKVFGLEIHTYGVFIAIAFLVSMSMAAWIGEKEGIKKDIIYDFAFYILIFSIIGARLLYVVIEYKYYFKYPLNIFKIWEGGLVYYGGFLGAVSASIFYIKRYEGISFFKIGDIFLTVLPLGQAIGRLGCLSAGCCYGKPCSLPWAIKFTDSASLAPLNVHLHPTEIYHMLADLIVFLILFLVVRKRKKFYGEVTVFYGILYSIVRFTVEFFRGDPRGFIGALSTSQIISVFIFTVAIIGYFVLKNRKIN